MAHTSIVVAVLVGAAVVGSSARADSYLPLLLAGLLVMGDVVLARMLTRGRGGAWDLSRFASPLSVAWLVVMLFPVHNFARRSNLDAVRQVGVQPVIELAAFGAAAALALVVIRTLEPTTARARPPGAFLLLPLWVVASGFWSDTGLYAIARGLQMLSVGLVGWATLAVGRAGIVALDALVAAVARRFVWVTLGLVLAGLAFGPIYVPASAENRERFTWIGAHPNGAGVVLAIAIVVVATAPRTMLRVRGPARAAMLVVLVAALYGNHSRTSWLCLACGLVVAFVVAARGRPALRWVGAPLLVAAAAPIAAFGSEAIWDYALRGGTADALRGGNGRSQLWSIGVDALRTPFDWLAGLGYGTARTLFLAELPWAVSAHSSILALLVSVGVVGVVLFAVLLVGLFRDLAVGRITRADPCGLTLVAILTVVVVNGLASDILAEPNLGFAVVVFVAAPAMAWRERRVAARARQTEPWRLAVTGPDTPRRSAAARSSSSSISTQSVLGTGTRA